MPCKFEMASPKALVVTEHSDNKYEETEMLVPKTTSWFHLHSQGETE